MRRQVWQDVHQIDVPSWLDIHHRDGKQVRLPGTPLALGPWPLASVVTTSRKEFVMRTPFLTRALWVHGSCCQANVMAALQLRDKAEHGREHGAEGGKAAGKGRSKSSN